MSIYKHRHFKFMSLRIRDREGRPLKISQQARQSSFLLGDNIVCMFWSLETMLAGANVDHSTHILNIHVATHKSNAFNWNGLQFSCLKWFSLVSDIYDKKIPGKLMFAILRKYKSKNEIFEEYGKPAYDSLSSEAICIRRFA